MLEQAEQISKPKTTEIILGIVTGVILIVVTYLIIKKRRKN